MYHYYTYDGRTLCSAGALPYPEISALPETGEVLWVFHRPPLAGRDTFPVTDPAQLTEEEGVASLCTAPCPEDVPPALRSAIRAGRVRAVNGSHPRLEELLAPVSRPEKVRVNLLALGDVGSTLLLGLRLMGGDVISSIGICDLREGVARRWEFELNQIQLPGPYDALPPVEIVPPERLFDGDVFLFCASRFVPDTAVKTGDVRMAQYQLNRELAAQYAAALGELSDVCGTADYRPAPETLARCPDVLTVTKADEDLETVSADLCAVLDEALAAYNDMRAVEGQKLAEDISNRLDAIERYTGQVEMRSPETVAEYRAKLTARMEEVLQSTTVDEQRILMEAAIYADKVAVDEETVRLRSHVAQLRTMLASD